MTSKDQLLGFWVEYYRKINTYYYIIILLPLSLFAVKYIQLYAVFNNGGKVLREKMLSTSAMSTLIFSLVFIAVIHWLYFNSLKSKLTHDSPVEKLEAYKKIFLKYAIILQSYALLIVVLLYIIDFPILAVVYGIILVVSSMQRPSYLRIFRKTKLTKDEKKSFLGLSEENKEG